MWTTAALGLAIQFGEGTLGAAARQDGGSHGAMDYVRQAFGPLGKLMAPLFAVAICAATLAVGGLFQGHQGAAVLHDALGTLVIPGAWIVAAVAAPFVLVPRVGTLAVAAIRPLIVLYIVLAAVVIAAEPSAVAEAFARIFEHAFGASEAAAGTVGGVVTAAVYHGALRATFANESGLGTAAFASGRDGDSPADHGRHAMLVPWVTTFIVGTLTAVMVLMSGPEQTLTERRTVPLERFESRGLQPSMQVGQIVILPEDTKLEANKRYEAVLRSNPRGHRLGSFFTDDDALLLPEWAIAKDTDTLILRRPAPRAQQDRWLGYPHPGQPQDHRSARWKSTHPPIAEGSRPQTAEAHDQA